jgi:hypothetical protein
MGLTSCYVNPAGRYNVVYDRTFYSINAAFCKQISFWSAFFDAFSGIPGPEDTCPYAWASLIPLGGHYGTIKLTAWRF